MTDVQDRSMTLDLTFSKPEDITPLLTYPDTLAVEFKVRYLIIDAESFEPLSEDQRKHDLEL